MPQESLCSTATADSMPLLPSLSHTKLLHWKVRIFLQALLVFVKLRPNHAIVGISWSRGRARKCPQNSLWSATNYGQDIIVGVIDTGIWPESPGFDDSVFTPKPTRWKGTCVGVPCNKKLIGAQYFLRGNEAQRGPIKPPEQRSPRDVAGHGTHVASTAAGMPVSGANKDGQASGVAKGGAPLARLAIYKVIWNEVVVDADLLAAIDAALTDGVDVINLSLGKKISTAPYFAYLQDALSIGGFHAVQAGVPVIVAGGNEGPAGYTVVNIAPWVLTVAASTVDRYISSYVVLGDNQVFSGVSWSRSSLPANRSYPLVYAADISAVSNITAATLCLPGTLNLAKAQGKIVLCRSGQNDGDDKGETVRRAGGAGMIMENPKNLRSEAKSSLPATHVGSKAAEAIYDYIQRTQSPVVSLTLGRTQLGYKPAPVMGSFSSRGPNTITPDILKPDVTAPGVEILAAWTGLKGSQFEFESGTSMASPHVTGVAALLRSLYPRNARNAWSVAAITSAIMTTATIQDNEKSIIKDYNFRTATPFQFGNGHIVPNAAADPGLVYGAGAQDYAEFLCTTGYSSSTIQQVLGVAASCNTAIRRGCDLNRPSVAISNLRGQISVWRSVTFVGRSPATFQIYISEPPGVGVRANPSQLSFTSYGETAWFQLSFTVRQPSSDYSFGWFVWSDGIRQVRSSIAVQGISTASVAVE
ncbi:hypothetical protein SELMODRAFT_267609 [Selaginella moellendorffii]|uniref:Peptidase S8/S53 domain-containing protein n=2 Tax=Selaginella moellendorffii TaxID=88036 RepID=D8RQM6_SELML|nr:hypothetical protein SELMODRAFT_267609 [Selaginella moellendorffii]